MKFWGIVLLGISASCVMGIFQIMIWGINSDFQGKIVAELFIASLVSVFTAIALLQGRDPK